MTILMKVGEYPPHLISDNSERLDTPIFSEVSKRV